MSIFFELQKVWRFDQQALKLVPIEKVFTGSVPDKYVDKDGKELDLDAPYVCIWSPDGLNPGGTSMTIQRQYTVQVSCFHTSRAKAEELRDFARDLFEDCHIVLQSPNEVFQDISLDTQGELPVRDGVFEIFQRFIVETALTRPRRKRIN